MNPLALLILILAAGLVVYALTFSSTHSQKPRRHGSSRVGGVDRAMVANRWATITASADSGGAGLRNAVSEADKLVDYVLRQSGVPGETMADRLRAGGRRFNDVDSIWRAHKLRNSLAHEVGFDLVPSQAREALRDFERGLKDLGAL
jgi:hypothetical protein